MREDEEQAKRFQDIIDLLLAAGYFRARIKGLSNFDKVRTPLTFLGKPKSNIMELIYHEQKIEYTWPCFPGDWWDDLVHRILQFRRGHRFTIP